MSWDSPPQPREYLEGLPRYAAGREPEGLEGGRSIKLSSNESPYPLPAAMVEAMAQAARQANRYPPDGRELARRLAAGAGVPPEMVTLAGGSLVLLRDLLSAYAGAGGEVLYGWRSYEAYPILVQTAGARSTRVPLRHQELDLRGLAAAASASTRVVLLANPNNPTGTVVGPEALEEFAQGLPRSCLLVLDEAYSEYADPDLGPEGIQLARELANVVTLRTFSKAQALAGMRVGWGVAHPDVVDVLQRVALPFTLTAVAQAAALAALDHSEELQAQVRETIGERDRVTTQLRLQGFPVPPSRANFVWLPLGAGSGQFLDCCASAGIGVRRFAEDGVRVTIGTPEENDRLLEAASDFAGRPPGPAPASALG